MSPLEHLRRLAVQAIDPDLSGELADLWDRNVDQFLTIQHQRTLMRDLQAQMTVERAIQKALLADAERDASEAKADVARLLEDAARCAHHTTT